MKKFWKKIFIFFSITIIVGLCISSLDFVFAQDDVVVVLHKSRTTLAKSEIQRIFKGIVSTFSDGERIQVMLNRDRSVVEKFCRKYLNMSADRLDQLWVKKSIRDGSQVPRKLPSNVIMTMIANSKVFIGIVKRSEVNSNVKINE